MKRKILLSACVASATLILSGCGSSSDNTDISGTFVDAAVVGLPYTCAPSGKNGKTDAEGKFYCTQADKVTFKLGETTMGPIETYDDIVVTPYRLFPKDTEAAVNLAQLLLTLDSDGNPDNVITLDATNVEKIVTSNLDFTSDTFEADAQALLDEANLTLTYEDDAVDHLKASDTTKPIVTLAGEASVTMNVGGAYVDAGATAFDEFDGVIDPVKSGTVDTATAGTYTITYKATDKAGNVGIATRTVVVKSSTTVDTVKPVVTLKGEASITLTVGDTYTDAGATATDDVDGAITPLMTGAVNTATAGTYTITWTATDKAGNKGTATRTVTVKASSSVCQNVNPITGDCED